MNTYILNTKELQKFATALENAIYKQKLKHFSYDPTYTPNKTEIPVECIKKALKEYKF